LERAADKYVIFALDDYLVSGYIDMSEYLRAEKWMSVQDLACIKLCYATIEENLEYPVTTQYSLWNRECLMALLKRVLTPWEFEVKGRELIKEQKKQCGHVACIPYFANSSLSSRWTGVRLDGLKQEDIQTLISNGYI
jgi:hypothetical protein